VTVPIWETKTQETQNDFGEITQEQLEEAYEMQLEAIEDDEREAWKDAV
jgi:hypothetical protein